MIGIDIALALCGLVALLAVIRIVRGPDRGSRVVGAELLTVAVVAMIALGGVRTASTSTFDIVLVATMVAFLATVSFARALTGGAR
ncbi:monovalent cation/H+ antiporter complex subunit F [Pseudonocardia alni]|uniref:monovalent cation/H+ antiporter complex subunit F n=1 Tax=Pseudonocardia TaxID=1847 RepID=UPI001CF6E21E|nr:monovalent cation/H+ antiporter complex subunit F [Pseudonocardia sp. ICBG162]